MTEALPQIQVRRRQWLRPAAALFVFCAAFGGLWSQRVAVERFARRDLLPMALAGYGQVQAVAAKAGIKLGSPLPTRQSIESDLSRAKVRGAPAQDARRSAAPGTPGAAENITQHMDAPVLQSDGKAEATAVERMTAVGITGFLGIAAFFGVLAYVLLGVNSPHNRNT